MECTICFEKKWVTNTPCNHKICLRCILNLKNNECPFCRKKNIFNSLPKCIIENSKFSKTKYEEKKIYPDINNYYEFPPLG